MIHATSFALSNLQLGVYEAAWSLTQQISILIGTCLIHYFFNVTYCLWAYSNISLDDLVSRNGYVR